ncbi:ABC transporter substrate-binding protein [Georgenia sp. H159]|uniref:ABC transporter substrate-binding protein n=1 Tax=Georgenia sp. H159 TaxID=3076115 RepID=UPI002D77BFAD|nr:ABC transporter substrate-binding protein [Georgenia sp. H159]
MKNPSPRPRRPLLLRAAALAAIGSLALTACGQGENPADTSDDSPAADSTEGADGEATIRFSWWGSDARHQLNQELIEAFEAEHPDITVTPDYTDWGGYWDKLATQTAGGDTPDVLMQEERFLREYADRGVLADLSEYDIDTSQIEESIVSSGEFNDGLWGIPTGVNVRTMIADPQIFEEAGVEMPDDTTWTWDDYHELMVQISENTPEGVWGAQDFGITESVDMTIWARQHGQDLWDENGEIGFEPETMAAMWERSLALIEAGGAPPVSTGLEIDAGGPEQSLVATNSGALSPFWTNQLEAIAGAAGRDLELLRYPGETQFDRPGLYLKPAMALSMSADSDHPEAAATFIDWMLNSPEAGEIILSDRGLPANLEVREHIMDQLSEAEQQAATFIEEVSADIPDSPNTPPRGAGEVNDLLKRVNEEVLFGQTTPQEGAERFISEAASITG